VAGWVSFFSIDGKSSGGGALTNNKNGGREWQKKTLMTSPLTLGPWDPDPT